MNETHALSKETLAGLAKPSDIPRGNPSYKEDTPLVAYNTSRAARVLGIGPNAPTHEQNADFIVLKGLRECANGMVEEFASRGW